MDKQRWLLVQQQHPEVVLPEYSTASPHTATSASHYCRASNFGIGP